MRRKQWIVLAVWFAALIAALQFFRFQFGIFKISAAFILIGIPLMVLFARKK